jgi:hypothetical protein
MDKSNSVSPSGGKGGTSSSKSSPSSGGMKSGPGATGGAKTPGGTTAKTSAQKTSTTQNKSSTVARSVPGTSQAAAKNTALGRAAESASRNVKPSVNNPVSFSGRADQGIYGRFSGSNWQTKPGASVMGSPAARSAMGPGGWMNMQKTPGGYSSGFVNAAQVPSVNWSGSFANNSAFRNLSEQGMKLSRAIEDTALRTNQPVTVFSGGRMGGGMNHKTGNAIDSFMRDPVSGRPVGEAQVGKWASFPIAGVNSFMGRTVPVANRINDALAGPYKQFSNDVYDTVYQNPDVYSGVRGAMRYGGDFRTGTTARDFMHHDVTPGRGAASQPANHAAAVARAGQGTLGGGTMLAGGGLAPGAISAPAPAAVSEQAPVRMASAAIGSIPKPRPRPTMAPVPRPTPRPDSFPRGFGDTGIGRTVTSYSSAPPVPNMRPDTFPSGFGDTGIGRTVNQYTPPSFGDQGMGRTVNPYSQPAPPVPTARPDSFPRGFNDQGMGRPVNPYSAPVSPFSDAGVRKPVSPFAGQPPASIVPPIPKARPPMQGPPRPIGGMSFTPGLPDAQKRYYDRVAQTPGPQQPYSLPGYPGAQPAGTYTAPYDQAPRMSPFGNVGQEYHEHSAPPTPSQYRNEMPPAAPHMGTPASQTAQTEPEPSFWQQGGDLFKQASTAVTEKLAENKKMVAEIEKKVGPLTPEKVKMWAWFNGLGGGAGTGALPEGRGGNGGDIRYPTITPPPQQATQRAAEPDYTPADLIALKSRMVAAGASPEEIAFVDSLINQTA